MNIETTSFKNSLGIRLTSGDGDEYPGCKLVITGGHKYITINLPQLISPKQDKVYPKSWNAATISRLGRDWYYNYTRREYGITICENHVSFLYGLQAHDSSIDQQWGFFIPWLEKRMVRHTAHFFDGSVINAIVNNYRDGTYEKVREQLEKGRKMRYQVKDFDGELIEVDCYLETREWRQGTGWFEWVSVFCKPIVHEYVDLTFSPEVGRRKNTWKGGTIGHACIVEDGETMLESFKRYCSNNELTFIGSVPWVKKPNKVENNNQGCDSIAKATPK